MKLALNSEIQTYQMLTINDEVCIPSRSSILLAVQKLIIMETFLSLIMIKAMFRKIFAYVSFHYFSADAS